MICACILSLALPGCNETHKSQERETILDKVVSIPKTLVLDIPKLPPHCNEIPNLKRGYADIGDGKLYYEEEGQGIPLVLINGGPGGTHHNFHPHFSQIKDIARIIYYDQRGTGKSSSDDTGKTYTVKQAVEDLESLRQALKIDRWTVLGFSYGGLLAQCYALTYPEHCMGIILVAANTGFAFKSAHDLEYQIVSPAERDALAKINTMASDGKIETTAQVIYNKHLAGDWKSFYYHKPTNEAMVRHALYNWNPASGFEDRMRQSSYKIGLEGKFDDFEIPTLIAEAKWDLQWLEPNRFDIMRKNHPHAHVEMFEKSGHYIFVDEPEKFFSLLRNFLKKSSTMHIEYKPGNRLIWPKFTF